MSVLQAVTLQSLWAVESENRLSVTTNIPTNGIRKNLNENNITTQYLHLVASYKAFRDPCNNYSMRRIANLAYQQHPKPSINN